MNNDVDQLVGMARQKKRTESKARHVDFRLTVAITCDNTNSKMAA